MIKIKEKPNNFKRLSLLLLGLIWFSNGILHFYNYQNETNLILGILFLLLGIAYFFMHYYYRNTGYIAWDDTEIIVSQWQRRKPNNYLFTDISSITVTNSHFILKSKRSKGFSLSLKSFNKEDIALLQSTFSTEVIPSFKQC